MRYLLLTLLMFTAPLSWGEEIRLVCTGTRTIFNYEPVWDSSQDFSFTMFLQNETEPPSAKIAGIVRPLMDSADGESYVGYERVAGQGEFFSWRIHRQTLKMMFETKSDQRVDYFEGQCERVKFKPKI